MRHIRVRFRQVGFFKPRGTYPLVLQKQISELANGRLAARGKDNRMITSQKLVQWAWDLARNTRISPVD